MKKAWHIWSLFLLCLVAVAIAMSWLSLKAIRLDAMRETDRAETELARREAELQERISSALYRMDLKMLPLVAQEAARPPNFYRPFYDVAPSPNSVYGPANNNNEKLRLASPLLLESSEWVLLHFEIDATNQITSPKLPQGAEREEAIANFQVHETVLDETVSRIRAAGELFDYSTLSQKSSIATAAMMPEYYVPAVESFRNSTFVSPEQQIASENKIDVQRFLGDQRINEGFNRRRDSTQELTDQGLKNNGYLAFGNNTVASIKGSPASTLPDLATHPTHPMQPIWLGENLIMARQSNQGDRPVVQCCWLNWEKIRKELQSEVSELLPELQFEAVTSDTELKIGTALTTIPVQLIIDRPKMLSRLAMESLDVVGKPSFPIPLLTAWCCLGLAATASALLLHGVMRLSERRAAFVSAVTHELRTPLTTFRMYSEMLAEGMVPEEKREQYARTMKVQADRLSHLVENVLQFARLERGPAKVTEEAVKLGDLFDRIQIPMQERAADSQMRLVIELDERTSKLLLVTQPAAIEQILFNLVDNACKYAHTAEDKRIVISVDVADRHVRFHVRDFGPGIAAADRKRIFEPFQQSENATKNAISGVGLGLALCRRMAQSMGGRLVDRNCSTGAWFELELPLRIADISEVN